MRVISGEFRGRKLTAPKGDNVRPTTDKVKEAVFSMLQFDIPGRTILDLFAGTGQMGIECLSRGAKNVVFTDNSRQSVATIKDNLAKCNTTGDVYCIDALSYLEKCGKFDIVFIDPPYDSKLYEPVLNKICKFDILNDGGIIICESRLEETLPNVSNGYSKIRERNYSGIKITVITK